MTGRELIAEILKHPNIDLPISISVDYDNEHPYRRIFAEEYLDLITNDPACIPILFSGYSNNDKEKDN